MQGGQIIQNGRFHHCIVATVIQQCVVPLGAALPAHAASARISVASPPHGRRPMGTAAVSAGHSLPHQKRDTKNGPRRQAAGMALPWPNSAHGDQVVSREIPRCSRGFQGPSYIGWWSPDWLAGAGGLEPPNGGIKIHLIRVLRQRPF